MKKCKFSGRCFCEEVSDKLLLEEGFNRFFMIVGIDCNYYSTISFILDKSNKVILSGLQYYCHGEHIEMFELEKYTEISGEEFRTRILTIFNQGSCSSETILGVMKKLRELNNNISIFTEDEKM